MIARAALLAAAALLCAACGESNDGEPAATSSKRLVYTRALGLPNQAIWIGDVEGRHMRRLTRGNYGLVSPDGRTIATSRKAGIYAVDAENGAERFVAKGKPAVWLLDSRHLLAIQGRALVKLDVETSKAVVIDRAGALTWSLSPDGKAVAYEVLERESRTGLCDPKTNIYIADVDGGSRRRLTRDGRSSNPVWAPGWIAFALHPAGAGCFKPRVWKIRPDGTGRQAVMRRLPRRFAWNGYYGVRPYGWVGGRPIVLAAVISEWGPDLVLVHSRTGRARKPDLDPRPRSATGMPIDHPSKDGRHVLGAACGAEGPCTIWIYSVLSGRAREVITANVAYPHWNR